MQHLCEHLHASTEGSYEVILVANSKSPKALADLGGLLERFRESIIDPTAGRLRLESLPSSQAGKGRAIQKGVSIATGEYVFFVDADLPYGLDFLDSALEILKNDSDVLMVAANRRLPESRFNVPVPILKTAYTRHTVGRLFNLLIRTFLPIDVLDTQAGMKLLTKDFAREAFQSMISRGFWFDIELFLILRERGLAYRSLPVELRLNCEKSTINILRHGIDGLVGIARIGYHYRIRASAPRNGNSS